MELRQPSFEELVEWIKSHSYAYYHAPMDSKPYTVQVIQYTVAYRRPEVNSRATLYSDATKSFVVRLSTHLDRFRVPMDWRAS